MGTEIPRLRKPDLPHDKPALFAYLRALPAAERAEALRATVVVLRADVRRALTAFERLNSKDKSVKETAAQLERAAAMLKASAADMRVVSDILRETTGERV